jgi:hypothetical protein
MKIINIQNLYRERKAFLRQVGMWQEVKFHESYEGRGPITDS